MNIEIPLRGPLARLAFAIIDRPRFDVACPLARLASEKGHHDAHANDAGGRRGQGQVIGGLPRSATKRTHGPL
jgi:hypothetical protein